MVWLPTPEDVVTEIEPKFEVKLNVPSPPTVFFMILMDPGVGALVKVQVTTPPTGMLKFEGVPLVQDAPVCVHDGSRFWAIL